MMCFQAWKIVTGIFCFLLFFSVANAADYKDWVPLLPESIGGYAKTGDPEGINMEQGGKSWSTVQQGYSDSSGEELSLIVLSGTAPQLQQFQSMKQFSMQTEDRLVETAEVSGNQAVLEVYKGGGEGTIMIKVQEKMLVVIEAGSVAGKGELTSLAEDVPLADIAAQR